MSTEQIETLQDMSQDLCLSLKPHCIKLSDAFGSKEKLLQSAIAKDDGQVYENFLDAVYSAKGCFDKADWAVPKQDKPTI